MRRPCRSSGVRIGLVGGELAGAGGPGTQDAHAGRREEAVLERRGRLVGEEPLEVLGVVEHEGAVHHGHRRVQRAQGGRALDYLANGLDPAGIVAMRETLRHLASLGKTVFVSSHLLAEMQQMADVVGMPYAAGRWFEKDPSISSSTQRERCAFEWLPNRLPPRWLPSARSLASTWSVAARTRTVPLR